MPQMSPMNWLYLYIYFIMLYFFIMILINNLMDFYKKLNNPNKINLKILLMYKFKW